MPAVEPMALLVVALVLFPLFFLAYWFFSAFRDVGFTGVEAALLVVAAPVSHGLNVLVWEEANLVIAVNLAGFLVPLVVSGKIVLEDRVPRVRTALAVALVAAFAFRTSYYVEGDGIRVLVMGVVAAAALVGIVATIGDLSRAPLVAYVAGALGVLVGADLLRLPDLMALQPGERTVLSIGGAGTLDAIFVAGLAAVGLQVILFAAFGRRA